MSDEATVNPDGSTTYEQQPPLSGPAGEPSTGSSSSSSETGGNGGAFHETPVFDNTQDPLKEAGTTGGIDPAVYLVVGVLLIIALYYFFFRSKKDTDESDDFFNNLDGEKVRMIWLIDDSRRAYFLNSINFFLLPVVAHFPLFPISAVASFLWVVCVGVCVCWCFEKKNVTINSVQSQITRRGGGIL